MEKEGVKFFGSILVLGFWDRGVDGRRVEFDRKVVELKRKLVIIKG